MKKLVLTATAALALSAVSFAMAGGQDQNQVKKHGGVYVGAGLGYADIDVPKGKTTATFPKVDNNFNHFTANAHVGYLASVSQNLLVGAEVGYDYLPTLKSTFTDTAGDSVETKFTSYDFDFMGVAKYYLTDELNIFGKAGAAYMHSKLEATTTEGNSSSTVTAKNDGKFEPKVAGGLGYNITPNLEVTAEYDHTFGTNFKDLNEASTASKSDQPSNNVVLVGLNYYFN